jgi:high-affinity nickel-transport protein
MRTRTRITLLLSFLIAANVLFWLLTWNASHTYALLLSTGLLAYGFGLRHAVDADHISAIDNTTRKLMQDGQKPIGVGFFFSLGHSTVVVLLCAALALSTAYVERHLPQWKNVGGVAGTIISGCFLYLIGIINLIVMIDLFKAFKRVANGENYDDLDVDQYLANRGLIGRFFRPLFRMVSKSWHMYLIGFLFGLGFDTATEVGILAVSAHGGQVGMSFWTIMLLPALFTVGMCLVDTSDGILMLGAYGWAFIKPIRKLYYNLCITLLSVLVAFVVGTYELLQIMQAQFNLHGSFWDVVARLNFDNLGFVIIGTFVAGWLVSMLVYKWKKYETVGEKRVEEKTLAGR